MELQRILQISLASCTGFEDWVRISIQKSLKYTSLGTPTGSSIQLTYNSGWTPLERYATSEKIY